MSPCTTRSASAVERKSRGNGTVICSPRTFRRNLSSAKPASDAPPVTLIVPPPKRPVSESICARSAVKRTSPPICAMVRRSSSINMEKVAPATVAVPVMLGCANVPVTRTPTRAAPATKMLRERLLRTRRFRSPSTVKFCRPPSARAAVPPKVTFVPGPTNVVLSKVISVGVKETRSGSTAESCTSCTCTTNWLKLAVPRSAPSEKPSSP